MAYTIDVTAEREATPGCATVAHLNNAGAALPRRATLAVVEDHLRSESELGGYEAAGVAAERLAALRASAARLLGAAAGDVVITGSDTQSWTKALWGFALGGGVTRGQRILADRIAYDSHYLGLLQVCRLTGGVIEVVASTPDGTLDLEALSGALADGDVAMAALTHIGTHRGLVNPVEEAGAACRLAGVPFFLDACQSVGQIPVDVRRIGCDVATATGRKWLRGPRGTGLLYVESAFAERLEPPGIGWSSAVWVDADHYRLRDGTDRFLDFEVPAAAHLGLGDAIDHALALGIEAIGSRVVGLAERLRGQLAGVEGVTVHDGGTRRSGIVTFTAESAEPGAIAAAASAHGINVSVSESPWARLDMAPPNPTTVVRASPHYYNTEDELDRLVDTVRSVTNRTPPLRQPSRTDR
ncbi:MAG: aminotransferase class V-fold PLP-dependent enzyme [Acidimicrobiales bacterium]